MNGLVETASDLVIPAAAVVATAVGLWLAHNYRRQMALRLSQTRLEAYTRLWEMTGVGAPTRLDGWGDDGYLRLDERRDLWAAMTDWYYAKGGGMLLTEVTKTVYLNVKHNLICKSSGLRPNGLAEKIISNLQLSNDQELDDKIRGTLAIRLLSLLRTQLKSDLRVYGPTYAGELSEYEIFFLEQSGVDLGSEAWATAAGLPTWWARLRRSLKTRWQAVWLRPAGSKSDTKAQPSPLQGMTPILDAEGTSQTPPSSRSAIRNALDGASDGSMPQSDGDPPT
jgi:hypothetical protein